MSKIKDCNFCQLKQKPLTDIKLLELKLTDPYESYEQVNKRTLYQDQKIQTNSDLAS